MYLAIPVNERDGGTVYNTILLLRARRRILGKHRKLVATGGERLAWGMGDGSTLTTFDTPFGRVGGLICWENYMPLARVAMYEQQHRHPSRADVGQLRRVARVDASHREGGALLRLGITSCLRGVRRARRHSRP